MNQIQLTGGFISERLFSTADDEETRALLRSSPTLQVLSLKEMPPKSDPPPSQVTYRLILSDGEHYIQTILRTELSSLVQDGSLVKTSIITLEEFLPQNPTQGKRAILISGLRVVRRESEKIGSPKLLEQLPPTANTSTPVTEPADTNARSGDTGSSASKSTTQDHPPASTDHGLERSIISIDGLSSYKRTFTIKALVTQKSDMHTVRNGQAKRFTVTLKDEFAVILAIAYGNDAENLFDQLQRGRMYYISNGKLQPASKTFNSTKHAYELIFQNNTVVEECQDYVPEQYRSISVADVHEQVKDSFCDVVGVVTDSGTMSDFKMPRDSRSVAKREITIADQSGTIRVTLWGKHAQNFDPGPNPVVSWTGLKVKEFRGEHSLSMITSSVMIINPDTPEAHALRTWYDTSGKADISKNFGRHALDLGQIQNINDVRDAEVGMHGHEEAFLVQGVILYLGHKEILESKFWYPACQNGGCNKKVEEQQDGWLCKGCARIWDKPSYRYSFSLTIADHSGHMSLSGFNDVGLILFERTADELEEIKSHDQNRFIRIMEDILATSWNFRCKAKEDTFNEQVRVRYRIETISPQNHKEEGHYLKRLLLSSWAQ